MITVLKILACWGLGSIAVGLWIGPLLRLATAEVNARYVGRRPIFPNGS